MNYKSIRCGGVSGKEYSVCLPGALATHQYFSFLNRRNKEYEADYLPIICFIPDDIIEDSNNDIFIGKNGAIVDAYDFSKLTKDESEQIKKDIIAEQKLLYPDYNFEIIEGKFPISVEGGNLDIDEEPIGIMSSHILYITNYKDHLKTPNNKSL